jgi:hypothetical protein
VANDDNNDIEQESYDAGDKKAVNNARKRAARKESERLNVVYGIMSVKEGRTWMYEYLAQCGTFTSPFSQNHNQTDFNCGKQHIGHLLLADIMKAAPEQYWKMVKEASVDEKEAQ